MSTGILVERFLTLGIGTWAAALVIAVGALFGLWQWRERWPLVGGLAGLGSFGLYIYANPTAIAYISWVAGLFIGAGIALTYGTVFLRADPVRPRLIDGTVEERLWLLDTTDAIRPQWLDWVVTAVLFVPGMGLIYLGLRHVFDLVPVVVGAVSLFGPAYAAFGLTLRGRTANRLTAEIDGKDVEAPAGGLPAGDAG